MTPDDGYFDGIGDADGYEDLTCHFVTYDLVLEDDSTEAGVTMTVCPDGFANGCANGTDITTEDAVNIVKDC